MEYHSWNFVRLDDDKRYYVDVTLDDAGDYTVYDNFAKGMDSFADGHLVESKDDFF